MRDHLNRWLLASSPADLPVFLIGMAAVGAALTCILIGVLP